MALIQTSSFLTAHFTKLRCVSSVSFTFCIFLPALLCVFLCNPVVIIQFSFFFYFSKKMNWTKLREIYKQYSSKSFKFLYFYDNLNLGQILLLWKIERKCLFFVFLYYSVTYMRIVVFLWYSDILHQCLDVFWE